MVVHTSTMQWAMRVSIPVNHSKSAVEIPKLHSFHREADPRLALHMLCMHLKCIQAYVLWQLILMSIFCYYLLLIVVKALCTSGKVQSHQRRE